MLNQLHWSYRGSTRSNICPNKSGDAIRILKELTVKYFKLFSELSGRKCVKLWTMLVNAADIWTSYLRIRSKDVYFHSSASEKIFFVTVNGTIFMDCAPVNSCAVQYKVQSQEPSVWEWNAYVFRFKTQHESDHRLRCVEIIKFPAYVFGRECNFRIVLTLTIIFVGRLLNLEEWNTALSDWDFFKRFKIVLGAVSFTIQIYSVPNNIYTYIYALYTSPFEITEPWGRPLVYTSRSVLIISRLWAQSPFQDIWSTTSTNCLEQAGCTALTKIIYWPARWKKFSETTSFKSGVTVPLTELLLLYFHIHKT
jgi:hypothetical protein